MFDYQEVKMVSMTKPVDNENLEHAQDIISYCARVSNKENQNNTKTSEKLLSYLMREGHWSPFEMVDVTFEIITTRDISRQMLRHRSFHFQEFSQRYAEVVDTVDIREARYQDKTNRQNSIDIDPNEEWDRFVEDEFLKAQKHVLSLAIQRYNETLSHKIAKEQARVLLPEGLTKTTLYMKGTLRDWIHFCNLRRANGTQKEHQDIANKIWAMLIKEFPFLETIEQD